MRAAMACQTGTGAIRSRFSNALTRAIVSSGRVTPEGLVYRPELLTEAEERALLDELERLDFHEIRMHGVVAKRTARHFGVDYDYERRAAVQEAEPIPDWLVPVRERAAELAGVEPEELAEILVQRYPPGAQIGWHRDAPAFGIVVGISLGSSARMRFRRDKGGVRHTFELELEPRSGYVLAGEARTAWQHHLPPAKALRYSITFRTLHRPR
jgi:alkylated DNA repair dioxygenase AlkB